MTIGAATITYYTCAEWLRKRGYPIDAPKRVLVSTIQAAVAERFGVPVRELSSARRDFATARARQVAIYLARELTAQSLPGIGRFFNRDHTTVIHSLRRIETLRGADADLDAHIVALLKDLAPMSAFGVAA